MIFEVLLFHGKSYRWVACIDENSGDVIRVMDGNIDPFMQAYLQWKGGKKQETK